MINAFEIANLKAFGEEPQTIPLKLLPTETLYGHTAQLYGEVAQ